MAPERPERAVPRLLTQAVVLPAVLSALVALVLVAEVRALVTLSRWVQHTDQVISEAQRADRLLADRESGLRGYLLTGLPHFLDPHTRSNARLERSFADLADLVADDPPQRERVVQMRQLAQEWQAFALQALKLHSAGDEASVKTLLRTGAGQERMESLRSQFQAFIGVEEGLRDARTRSEQMGATRIIGVSVVLLLMLGLLLGLMARRQLRAVARGYGQALFTAEHTMELREEFLTVAAHELRTPLTALQLQLQRIRREMEREPQPQGFTEHLGTALRQTRRLWSLIESLLDAYTLSAGTPVELSLEDIDLLDLA
ncbi:MAG TPA: CHASE3 domain-containing protein, partial [Myxococcales bacterium]|nr:CHASE3 domain-containing protein [Myxococcales bacterium]